MSSSRSERSNTPPNDDLIFSFSENDSDNESSSLIASSHDHAIEDGARALRKSGFIARSTSFSSFLSTPHNAYTSDTEDDIAQSVELKETPQSGSIKPTPKIKIAKRTKQPKMASSSRASLFNGDHALPINDHDGDEIVIPLMNETSNHVAIDMSACGNCSAGNAALDAMTWIIAATTAAPTALYAAFGTTSPGNINSAWWNDQTTLQQVLTATYGLSSEAVNTIMSALFLPTAANGLINGVKSFTQHPIRFMAANIGGLAAAFSSFALAYSPFKPFIGNAGATTFAGFNALVAFTQRFVGTESLFKRINNTFFSKESALQRDVLDKLSRLSDKHLQEIGKIIQQVNRNEQDFSPEKQDQVMQALFGALAKKMDALQTEHGKAIADAPRSAYTFKYLMLIGDLLFATAMGAAVFCSFGQKGYQAFDNIEQIATAGLGHIFSTLHPGLKILLSFLPGMISSAFYFINALDLRATAVHVATEIHHSYQESRYRDLARQVFTVACVLTLNGLASKSMLGVGASVANNPNNLFGIPSTNTSIGMLYAVANQIAGGAVNIKSTLAKTFPTQAPPPLLQDFGTNDENQALKRYLSKFAAYFSDPSAHPISKENFTNISNLSLFGGSGIIDCSQLPDEMDETTPDIIITSSSFIREIPQPTSTQDNSYIGSLSAPTM